MNKVFISTILFLFAVCIGFFFFVRSINKELKYQRELNTRLELRQEAAISQLEILEAQRHIEDSLRLLPSKEHEALIDSIRNWNSNELKQFIESAVR